MSLHQLGSQELVSAKKSFNSNSRIMDKIDKLAELAKTSASRDFDFFTERAAQIAACLEEFIVEFNTKITPINGDYLKTHKRDKSTNPNSYGLDFQTSPIFYSYEVEYVISNTIIQRIFENKLSRLYFYFLNKTGEVGLFNNNNDFKLNPDWSHTTYYHFNEDKLVLSNFPVHLNLIQEAPEDVWIKSTKLTNEHIHSILGEFCEYFLRQRCNY